MKTNEKFCRNCSSPISDDAKYCSQCSQKNTDGKVPLWQFLQDFFSNLLNFDSKLVLTFLTLFIPGKLTEEYFKGRHQSYASPVRMFLFTGITLFAIVIVKTKDLSFGVDKSYYTKQAENLRLRKVVDENLNRYDTTFFEDTTQYYQTDSLKSWIYQDFGTADSDSIKLGNLTGKTKLIKIAVEDFSELSLDSILSKYDAKEGFESIMISQQIKAIKDGKGLFHYYIGKLPIMIFFMMPFLAMVLKLLYIRKGFYFVEHLVFSFHYHTFAFLLSIFLVLLGKYLPGIIIGLLITSIFVYLLLAMRRFYKQGFIKTLIKFFILNFSYTFLAFIFFLISLTISFLLY